MSTRTRLAAAATTVTVGIAGGTYYSQVCACSTPTNFTGAGAATHLAYTTQPGGAVTGSAFGTQPVVKVEDTSNNVVVGGPDSTVTVTIAIQTGSGTLLGTLTKAAVAGVAAFTNLQLNTTGSRTLRASATLSGPGAVTADSASFTVGAPGTANVWMASNGSDSGVNCTRSASLIANPDPTGATDCLSFSKSHQLASPGDTISGKCGTFPGSGGFGEGIAAADDKGTGPAITFDGNNCVTVGTGTPAAPAPGGLTIQVSNVTVKNLAIAGTLAVSGCSVSSIPDSDTFTNVTAYRFYIEGATNFLVEDSDFGPIENDQNFIQGCAATSTSTSGVFNNNVVHDMMSGSAYCSSNCGHQNAIYMDGGNNGVTISNNKVENWTGSAITIDVGNGPGGGIANTSNILIFNNVVGPNCERSNIISANDNDNCGLVTSAIRIRCSDGWTMSNVSIYNNTTANAGLGYSTTTGNACGTDTGNTMDGNLGLTGGEQCGPNPLAFTLTYNLYIAGAACGTGSATGATINFVSPNYPNYNYALTGTNTACDFVPVGQTHAATDFLGATRPDSSESFFDAGAYESCP